MTFRRPFALGGASDHFPAGRYAIETDEDLLDGMFAPAYLPGLTMMQKIAEPRPGITERAVIDRFQLDAALALDHALDAMAGPDRECVQVVPVVGREFPSQGPDIGLSKYVKGKG